MKSRELGHLGIPKGPLRKLALSVVARATKQGIKKERIRATIRQLVKRPKEYVQDELYGELAQRLDNPLGAPSQFEKRDQPAPFCQWGEHLEPGAVQQMQHACQLPVAVSGALMPDAHQGYGLPIGGVLATKNCVIPYAVGVDIACRMKLTVWDWPVSVLDQKQDKLEKALESETRFGIGAEFRRKRNHPVMDEDWSITQTTLACKDKAWKQLGSSGSGNHFVEFGLLTLPRDDLGLKKGKYVSLLSHSGSRGVGARVASYYSRWAMQIHTTLPRTLKYLAWLDLDKESGQEYWAAMELMGRYASANHELIHQHIARNLGAEIIADIENHHNYAWKEQHGGEPLIVHRKGATPAGQQILGIIPGSMATPGYVVRGKGNVQSLGSAAHGAGRKMSRTAAKQQFNWKETRLFLAKHGVKLLSAGLDEVPMAYKNIEDVMAAQSDLVEKIARFDPKLVKMAPAGERPED